MKGIDNMTMTVNQVAADRPAFPVETIRNDFPILRREFHDRSGGPHKPLVWLDNAATSQKPEYVIDAMRSMYEFSNANVHRSMNRLSEEATEAYESAREKVRRFIGARNTREIVFTSGTTASINLVAHAWGDAFLEPGDEILLTEMEHHSNLVPWQLAAERHEAHLRFIPFDFRGMLDMNYLKEMWSERIRFVALTHVSNVFGTVNPVREIIDFAHERGVPVLLDGAQSVPHMPVDVKYLDCDFLAFSSHKMCGPTGVGVLYGKQELFERMPPFMGGGDMISAVWLERAKWNDLPYKFEAGTPNYVGAVGLGIAIDYLESVGMENIQIAETDLTRFALKALSEVEGVRIFGESAERGGIVSFTLKGVHDHDLAQFLDSEGIAIRAGHHCAQPIMRKLGIGSMARASFYFYNTTDEIEKLASGVRQARRYFHHGT